ncbi:peptide chain release factor-like protein [Kiritimatiellota bacterium B12222]|nr:peptide chain release factor-like protein [Kiritimatiellota bacterium B12222]
MQASESPWERVMRRMNQLGLSEADLEESFVLGSGSGGQKVNKTASAVQLIHVPSGTKVKCGDARSQHLNRLKARERLCEKVEAERRALKLERDARRAKIRNQKRKPSARAQAKRVGNKRVRGEVKKMRGRPSRDD